MLRILSLLLIYIIPICGFAETIDFESGTDGQKINTSVEGVQFTTTNGQDWLFLDKRLEKYNSSYHVDGNFGAWLGTSQSSGRIDFDQGLVAKVSLGYSSASTLYLEAYDASGTRIDSDSGGGNRGSGKLDTLSVEASGIAYVLVHDTGNQWMVDNLKFELADVQLLELDLQEDSNEAKHNTAKYKDNMVFRRADTLDFNIVVSSGYSSDYYKLELVVTDSDGVEFIMADNNSIHATEWKSSFSTLDPLTNAAISELYDEYNDYVLVSATVYIPYDLPIGKYKFSVRLKRNNGLGEIKSLVAKGDSYIIFNPWSDKDDDVNGGMTDSERMAYVLKEEGTIYLNKKPIPWGVNQFDQVVFEQSMKFAYNLANRKRSNAWELAKYFSDMANGNNGNGKGILFGKWEKPYPEGNVPWHWDNSKEIFDEYKSSSVVKYAQCWVFSGVLNTMLRSIGIPARSITNISSGHDDNNDGVIKELQGDSDNSIDKKKRGFDNVPIAIWNFHVWNEAWLKRPDRNTYKQISWQAVDGTYEIGPAPVSAIKANASGEFYVDFMRTEVQAPYELWEEVWDGAWLGLDIALVSREKFRSKGMLTTDHNNEKIDVVNDYCSDCQASNNSDTTSRKAYKSANGDGVGVYQVEVKSSRTVNLGSTYAGNIVISNTGEKKDTFSTRILMLAESSNSQTLEKWGELIKSDIELEAGDSKTIPFSFIVPMSKKVMPASDSFVLRASVIGKEYTGYGELKGEIVALDNDLTVSAIANNGSATVTAKVTNHTSKDHSIEVLLQLPTGISSSENLVKKVLVAANSSVAVTWLIQVPNSGKYHLKIETKTPDLSPIYASADIKILESEDFLILINVPKLIQLGQTENIEVLVTNKGSRTLDLNVSVIVGSGLQADKQAVQVVGLLSGKTYSETVAIKGLNVGKHSIATFGKLITQGGKTLNKRAISMIAVQADTVKSTMTIQPDHIQYSGDEVSVALKLTTDSSINKEVKISSSASDKSIRYSIYDGNKRVLNQSIIITSGVEKLLTLKLESTDKSGIISVIVTPIDNPHGGSEASLSISIGTLPVANAGDDQTVIEGTQVTLTGIASTDPDGNETISKFDWHQIAGTNVTLEPVAGNPADVSFVLDSVGSAGEELHFRLTVTDDKNLTSTDEVIVFVKDDGTQQNNPPTATNDTITTSSSTPKIIDVLANDTDPDGDTLTISKFDAKSIQGGIITKNDDDTLTYTSKAGYTGSDSFTYTVSDGNGGTATATVNITVEDCFIATAAFGSYLHADVKVLRDFRDNYLLTNSLGKSFVNFYYKNSPPIAGYIAERDTLKVVVRSVLTPIVYIVKYPVLLLIFIVSLVLWRKRKVIFSQNQLSI